MARMGRSDIDRLDLRVGEKRAIAVQNARARETVAKPRFARIARGDGDEPPRLGTGKIRGEGLGDRAGAENAPANGDWSVMIFQRRFGERSR